MEAPMTRIESRSDQMNLDDFESVFRTCYAQVVRDVMRIVRDAGTAEDIAQDVFLRLYHTDRSEIESIRAWLAKSALFAAYNHLRSEKRRQQRDERDTRERDWVSPSTEEAWLAREEQEAVREALTDLEERDRLLLLMKYSGYSYKELADAVQVETGSVGTLLARAKRKLRALYVRKRGIGQ